MINPVVLIGEPLVFKTNIYIYPPKVKDILTNPKYGFFLKLLLTTSEDIKDELGLDFLPDPFDFLCANCYNSLEIVELTKEAFNFFCHRTTGIDFENQRIVFTENTDINMGNDYISKEEFFDFQNCLREAIGQKKERMPDPIDPNENPMIAEIKRRARERDRLKAKQQANKKDGISLSTCLVAICCMGIGITPLNIGEMSYASISEIMNVMQEKEKYDIDIRSLLAGADSKKIKPKYWIRNTND